MLRPKNLPVQILKTRKDCKDRIHLLLYSSCKPKEEAIQNHDQTANTKPNLVKAKKRVNDFDVPNIFEVDGVHLQTDGSWNIAPNVLRLLDRRILNYDNPLNLLKRRIVNHFNTNYRRSCNRSPLFTVCETEPRVVSIFDNFDSLLIPNDHPSRRSSDTYYINESHCLRGHTSAHQFKLIQQGLENFLVVGDVYRRDLVDRTHYPCFHQIEGVRTYTCHELFGEMSDKNKNDGFVLFEKRNLSRDSIRQECHTPEASRLLVIYLKHTLESLARALFGENIQMRWIDAYFPFTHPSFELEVFYEERWLEVLGCGVIEQKLLRSAGIDSKAGWAFGLGLERLAMILYGIPDIRLFWSRDTGFISQFSNLNPEDNIKYKPISIYPQLFMDLSFWLPKSSTLIDNDDIKSHVQDAIRTVGGDLVEQVDQIDIFHNKKRQQTSHCYRIIYRSMDRVLTKEEVNEVHRQIERNLVERFFVEIR